jgi:signal transduction histidine kinase
VLLLSSFVLLFVMSLFALSRLDSVYVEAQRSVERSIRSVLLAVPAGKPLDEGLDVMFAAVERLERVATRVEIGLQRPMLEQLEIDYRSGTIPGSEVLERFIASSDQLEINLAEKRRSISSSFYSLIAALSVFLVVSIAIATGLGYRLRMSRLEAVWSKRSLARSLEAEEDLRRRIARDLHDDAAQEVTAAKMLCERASAGSPADAARRSGEAARLLDKAGRKIRGLALDLRPPEMERNGLRSALESLCERQLELAGYAVKFKSDTELPGLSDEASIHAYRIAQEALSNAAKHARGHRVMLRVAPAIEDGVLGVLLEILDAPDSLVPLETARSPASFVADASSSSGLGLAIMRERAALINGRISADFVDDGFAVRLFVPAVSLKGVRS